MQKNKILSKLNINMKDYNNELEKILENKLFSYSVKNLLLSMLYKIENAYKDYETAKVEALSKKDYIENILRIIREKALKIFLVKSGTPEAEELEKDNVKYKIDRKNGEITCFQNEFVILTALLMIYCYKGSFFIAVIRECGRLGVCLGVRQLVLRCGALR